MNYNNILLTGDIKVGKSTIINKIINKYFECNYISGFKTLPFYEDEKVKGYYMEDQLEKGVIPNIENIVGVKSTDCERCFGITEVFEKKGVDILSKSIDSESDLVLLDEIGFFESEADNFKKSIHKILDSDNKVLGVLKKRNTEFIQSIRDREDVFIIEVTERNRNTMVDKIVEYWRL